MLRSFFLLFWRSIAVRKTRLLLVYLIHRCFDVIDKRMFDVIGKLKTDFCDSLENLVSPFWIAIEIGHSLTETIRKFIQNASNRWRTEIILIRTPDLFQCEFLKIGDAN